MTDIETKVRRALDEAITTVEEIKARQAEAAETPEAYTKEQWEQTRFTLRRAEARRDFLQREFDEWLAKRQAKEANR